MGKQKNIAIRGTFGGIIYYQWKGINCIRKSPTKVKQSRESQEQSGLFGNVSHISRIVRSFLEPLLPQGNKLPLMYKMNNLFRSWLMGSNHLAVRKLDQLPEFEGFCLNEDAGLVPPLLLKKLHISREPGSGGVGISIDALDIQKTVIAPSGTTSVTLQLMAIGFSMAAPEAGTAALQEHTILYSGGEQPAVHFSLPVSPDAGKLVLVAMALQFFTGNGEAIEGKKRTPAAIVGSFYN